MVILRCLRGFHISSDVLPAPLLKAWCVTAKALPDISAISALIAVKHGNYSSLYTAFSPVRTRKSLIWPWMASDVAPVPALWALASTRFYVTLKTQAAVGNPRAYNRAVTSLSALKWTNSGATSVLNHVSAGCFTRMTGYGGRLWRTSSVNALWRHWSVFWACCRPLRWWYGWRMAGRCMNHAWRKAARYQQALHAAHWAT